MGKEIAPIESSVERPASHERSRADLVDDFYRAPDDAMFRQETVAAVLNKSCAWMELKRWRGGGPAWRKIGHNVLYTKRSVQEWLSQFVERNSKPGHSVETPR
jgi:hypothetical protein